MRILVVNPNTTQSMTQTIEAAAKAVASASTEIVAVTSSMGPVSIEGYYDEVFAIPGLLLEIAKAEKGGAQAAVIACFDDTGLDAARALATIPVIGICEAAVATAAFIAQRFTVVTTMERSRLPLEHLVHRYGMGARAKVRAPTFRFCRWKTRVQTPCRGYGPRSRQRFTKTRRRPSCLAAPAWRILRQSCHMNLAFPSSMVFRQRSNMPRR